METFFFYIFSLISILGGLLVILLKNVVHAALALLASFIGVAGLFLIIGAEFIAIIQILIYAGAIMILFLFAIFLLDIPKLNRAKEFLRQKQIAIPLVSFFTLMLGALFTLTQYDLGKQGIHDEKYIEAAGGNIEVIGNVMYTQYILPFEVISILLLAAMIGAIVIARKELK